VEQAKKDGMAFQQKGNDEIAVAFTPEHFAEYADRQEIFHQMASAPEEMELARQAVRETSLPEKLFEPVLEPRRKVMRSAMTAVRKGKFRAEVLRAYEYHCAICDVQLDLLDAAHIIPVEHEESFDLICNGMALCKNHHQAYDRLLLKVDENYRISLYQKKVESLRTKGHLGGLENFLSSLRQEIRLPSLQADRPRPEYLRRGIEIREKQLGFDF
jgi:putative restriction endonuclease